ncbi:Uncharacterised protein [Mycobacteroides abscessus subsp. abscessus]|nr:Uncharacterised protein [Mycobacteroides abscessus subsp. abscessus]
MIKCLKYTGIIILAAPLPKPDKPIAVAIATTDMGVTINKEYVTQIRIDINIGFSSVKELTKCPIPFVTFDTYPSV